MRSLHSSLCLFPNCENPRKPSGRGVRGWLLQVSQGPCPSRPGSFSHLGEPPSSALLQLPDPWEVLLYMSFLSLCLLPRRACQVGYTPAHPA